MVRTDMQEFITFFDSLPPMEQRKYETDIANWCLEKPKLKSEFLYRLLDNEITFYHENPDSVLFTAFVALCTYLRRLKDSSKYQALIEKYGDRFVSFKLYPHFCSMMYKELRTDDGYHSAILYASQAIDKLPEQEGILHNFAETVIEATEEKVELDPSYLAKAEQVLKKAMSLSPKYPKFHCTKGRLLAIKKDYKTAAESILKAIDLEDSSKHDYVLRINDYQNYLAKIRNEQLQTKMEESIQKLTASKETLEKSLENAKTENLQMLGFFVAIITFTLGSFNIVKQDKIMDSVFLLFILTGCLIISYVAFTVLFSNNQNSKGKILIASALGLLLLGSGFAIHAFF